VTRGLHVVFSARDHAQVDAFWRAGVDAGYRDAGAPGLRIQYAPTYDGGFLLDPDGNSVEAVCGEFEGGSRSATSTTCGFESAIRRSPGASTRRPLRAQGSA